MKQRLLLLACVCFFLLAAAASAANRVALVVGCGKYRASAVPELDTPVQDAKDLGALLASPALGFDVIPVLDATAEDFYAGLRQFKTRAQNARVALIFFSGHGIENQGRNYLITVNAVLDTEDQLETQTVNLDRVMKDLAATNATVKLAILDCCRNNPFAKTKSWLQAKSTVTASVLRELGEAEIPQSTLVCFATSAGRKAAAALREGSKNSPFTQLLLEELPKPQQSLRTIFENVHDRLKRATANRQIPTVRTDNALSELFRQTVLVQGAPRVDTPPGGFFGLKLNSPSPRVLAGTGPEDPGVRVKEVDPDGPAARAGLMKNDLITALDGEKITRAWDINERIYAKRPGDRVSIKFMRGAAEKNVTVTLGEMPLVAQLMRQVGELRHDGKAGDALVILTRAIEGGYAGSRLAELHLMRASIYRDFKDYKQALEESRKVMTLFPNDAEGYKAHGYALQAIGKTAEAEADFKKAEELMR